MSLSKEQLHLNFDYLHYLSKGLWFVDYLYFTDFTFVNAKLGLYRITTSLATWKSLYLYLYLSRIVRRYGYLSTNNDYFE